MHLKTLILKVYNLSISANECFKVDFFRKINLYRM